MVFLTINSFSTVLLLLKTNSGREGEKCVDIIYFATHKESEICSNSRGN